MAPPTILAQLLSFIPKRDFRRCVEKHRGNHNIRTFSCWDQFVCMVVAQLARKESLREIETCLRGMKNLLYHTGLQGVVSRSTLADANERRSSAIYADFCHILIERARPLYADDNFIKDLDALVYVLDSTFITLSLAVCPWAYFGVHPPAAMRLHTQLDLRGPLPSFLHISRAKMNDNLFLDLIRIEAGAFYVMDKGYFDLARLYKIHQGRAFFIIRRKRYVKFRRIKSMLKQKAPSVHSDCIVRCSGPVGRKKFPDRLRLIKYRDSENKKELFFLTNNFDMPPATIAQLYKARWQVELFFRWIKQNLRLDSFLGYSQNAVEIQIWTAVAAYLTVAIAKKKIGIPAPLTQIVGFLPQALFLKVPIYKALSTAVKGNTTEFQGSSSNQLELL